jgi:uncharacterized protein
VKLSRYNSTFDLSAGPTLFFNYFTLALIGLKPAEARLAKKILCFPDRMPKDRRSLKLRKLFVKHGFLIDDKVHEIEYLKMVRAKSISDRSHLSLTLVPTLSCNFSCTYCYQAKIRQNMSPKIEAALIGYVQDQVMEKGRLSVTWFGGEPLLRLDTIERLSSAFLDICDKKNVRYSSNIITNGFLLSEDVSRKLADLRVKEAQITLDGPPEVHDGRRPLLGGGKTFEAILANIKTAAPRMEINIRMNVDQQNRQTILGLLDRLVAEGLNTQTGFYLGQTYPYTSVCHDVAGSCLKDNDFSLLELETALEMSNRGFRSFAVPKSRNHFCMADNESAFAVTPSGGMVKCWNEVTTPGAEVHHLLRPLTVEMRRSAERWKKQDPFMLECQGCLSLPICMGGCPYINMVTGNLHCHPWKHHPNENLVFYYYLKKHLQESEIIQGILRASQEYHGKSRAQKTTEALQKKHLIKKEVSS